MNLFSPGATLQMMGDGAMGSGSDGLEDELLVVRCQLGEAPAFDALIARWHPPLWQYARRLTGRDDAAADTVQEVWLRMLRGLPGLRDPARFRAWLFGIARHVVIDRLREQYRAPAVVDVDPALVAAPDAGLEDPVDLDRMHDALAALPVVEREVLVLFYLRELSLAGLAEVLDVPIGTVKSRLFRARRLLRARLTPEGEPS